MIIIDKSTLQILSLLKIKQSLNLYQLEVLLSLNKEEIANRLYDLHKNGYIELNSYEPTRQSDDYSVMFDTFYKITLEGERLLEEEKTANKKFKVQSIYVPFAVALITSIFTNLIAYWLK